MSVPATRRSLFSVIIAVLATAVFMTSAQSFAQSGSAEEEEFVYVKMETSKGDIIIELNQEKAPISVKNFLTYADEDFYDGTIFHRVMDGFMIQGGGFTSATERKSTNPPIKNEWRNGLKNERGTIAMARLGNQADSATSQFFINHKDNPFLDQPRDGAGYAVFGKVVDGMDVVDEIAAVEISRVGPQQHFPVEKIEIVDVEILPDYKPKG